jgi:RNA-directed DNA polymerase
MIGISRIFFRGGGAHSIFYSISSIENLLDAWKKFKKSKGNKYSVQEFGYNLESEILLLHRILRDKTYIPEKYTPFYVYDPKKRYIHKAEVRDRVVHQALITVIEPLFDKKFIYDSYACRKCKGTHKGVKRLRYFLNKVSQNNTKEVWILKCDVKRFFDSINHTVLKSILYRDISCTDTRWLVGMVIDSFEKSQGTGLPLGNLTSQFFGNVYLHELDFYIKHTLRVECYMRYCDDMVFVSHKKENLEIWLTLVQKFLKEKLLLDIHPYKIHIRKYTQGIDFLGYVIFPYHTLLRKTTKKRIFRKWSNLNENQKISYKGVLKYCSHVSIQKRLDYLVLKNKNL